jgi:hypothetical protein
MQKFRRPLFAVVGYLTLFGALALFQQNTAHSQAPRQVVRVLQNGPSDAVPVTLQGTGAIAGNVNVVNTPNVNVVNSPPVQLSSSVASPLFTRDVNEAVQPVQLIMHIDLLDNESFGQADAFLVPSGRRLVVEFVSAQGSANPGQLVSLVNLLARFNGATTFAGVRLQPIAPDGFQGIPVESAGSQLVRIYADPGSTLVVTVRRTGGYSERAFGEVFLSGYLAPVP